MTGQTTCTLRDLLLYTSIRDEGIDRRVMNLTVAGIKPLRSNRSTYTEDVTLTKWTGRVLDHTLDLTLRVTRCNRTPLTEVLKVFQRELTGQAELTVQHRSHVTRIQEETVSCFPTRILRIVLQKLTEEHVDEVSTTHSSARVTTLCFLYCCCG